MSKTNVAKLVLLALILASALTLIFHRRRARAPEVGDVAPDFTLPTLARTSVSLRDYRDNALVLNFWATWCPPCIEETPSLMAFAERLQADGVKVVGISVDQDGQALEAFVNKFQLSFPIARDPDQTVASRYGTFKFPETYIIDGSGRIADKLIGAIDWQDPQIIEFIRNVARTGKPPGM